MKSIAITYTHPELKSAALQLAEQLALPVISSSQTKDFSILLTLTEQRLELSLTAADAPGPVYAEFTSGTALHRHRYGGGRQQLIARAVGLHKKKAISICDLSAGLGKDAFVLASLGAKMLLLERSPIIAALLADGWQRAQQLSWVKQLSWKLMISDAKHYLLALNTDEHPEVIYFDPMFPSRKKTALVKKDMRVLREIVGEDHDAPEILALALTKAINRVVVKRPRLADPIPGPTPSYTLSGSSCRFDIYLLHGNR